MSLIKKAFKRLHYPVHVIAQCIRWYLAYSLSFRNLEKMMAERGLFQLLNRTCVHTLKYNAALRTDILSRIILSRTFSFKSVEYPIRPIVIYF